VRAKNLIASVTGVFKLKKARKQYRSESKKLDYSYYIVVVVRYLSARKD